MVKLSLFPFQDRCSHFRAPGKLRYPVRARLYLLERTVGSFKCKANRCQLCLNVNDTDHFSRTVDGKTYNIIQKFDCSAKCLIYLLTCQKCLKQYFGKTID